MLASAMGDPVIGTDLHMQIVVSPIGVPVPTLLPSFFFGQVFDPIGLVLGMAISAAMSGGASSGVVTVNSRPATNAGTEVNTWMTMPHAPCPPAIGFAMMGGAPILPGDAELYFGCLNVTLGGTEAVRLGEMALSCGDPTRLPTSAVLAIPTGFPVFIQGPPVPSVGAILGALAGRAILGALSRVMRMGGRLFRALRQFQHTSELWERLARTGRGWFDNLPIRPQRLRDFWDNAVCFVTGHPVDVASGRMFTGFVDLAIDGPLPLVISRSYSTSLSWRDGMLGRGWSLSIDQAVWLERGRAVLLEGDGREIEFSLMDEPQRMMWKGTELYEPTNRLSLRCLGPAHYTVTDASGTTREFGAVRGGDPNRARLLRIRSRNGHHTTELTYNARGLLERVRDAGGRTVELEYRGTRLWRLKAPVPHGRGHYVHRTYEVDQHGDLVRAFDAHNRPWTFEYVNHLMVRETDRQGLSFYFQYDGRSSRSSCIRTWGDGGIYDHSIAYAKSKTIVTDSLDATVVYEKNALGQIAKVTNANGGSTRYSFDDRNGQTTEVVDPVGLRTVKTYDERGNCTAVVQPHGTRVDVTYGPWGPVLVRDERGVEVRCAYDGEGNLAGCVDALGIVHRNDYRAGLLVRARRTRGAWANDPMRALELGGAPMELAWQTDAEIEHDERKNVRRVRLADGSEMSWRHDELGRETKTVYPTGASCEQRHDAEGAVVAIDEHTGRRTQYTRNAEGYVLTASRVDRSGMGDHVTIGYVGRYWVASREQAGIRLAFGYDTEGQLTSIEREGGERAAFVLSPTGAVTQETRFDGGNVSTQLDAANRPVQVVEASGRTIEFEYHEARGLLVGLAFAAATTQDRATVAIDWDDSGLMARVHVREERKDELSGAANTRESESCWERDALGRTTVEHQGDDWVRSEYSPITGQRVRLETSTGHVEQYEHDELGFASAVRLGPAGDWQTQIQRDRMGLELARAFSNGVRQEWQRDALGRPLAMQATNRGGTVIAALGFEWRTDEQLAAIVDPLSGTTARFAHDVLGQLAQVERSDGRIESRYHDIAGNLFRTPNGSDRRYGVGGKLEELDGSQVAHDAEGRRTRDVDAHGRVRAYTWNAMGHLSEVAVGMPDPHEEGTGTLARYDYDLLGRRTRKQVFHVEHRRKAGCIPGSSALVRELERTESFVHEERAVWSGEELVGVIASDEDAPTAWVRDPSSGKLIAKEQGSRRWGVLTDHLGTPTELVDELGQVAWRMQLDWFGVGRADVAETSCPWRSPGQWYDDETGLCYNRHRYYDPHSGTFISRDPAIYTTGLPYAYCADPTVEYDPDGAASRADFGIPYGKVPFARWFNSLSGAGRRSRALRGDQEAHEIIGDALRADGGMHEHLMVSQWDRLRQYGFTYDDITGNTTPTSTMFFEHIQSGTMVQHGGSVPIPGGGRATSAAAHVELERVFEGSTSRRSLMSRLRRWAEGTLGDDFNYRLPNGVADLPAGLRPRC